MAALTVLLRVLTGGFEAVRRAVPLWRLPVREGAWSEVYAVFNGDVAGSSDVAEVLPRNLAVLELSDDEVLCALLRGEATRAVDELLMEVGDERLELPYGERKTAPGLIELAAIAQRLADGDELWGVLGYRGAVALGSWGVPPHETLLSVVGAWLTVYHAMHQSCPGEGREVDAGAGLARCPACSAEFGPECGEVFKIPRHVALATERPGSTSKPDEAQPVSAEPSPVPWQPGARPEFVLEVPARVGGHEGNRELTALASQMERVLACRADVAPRGRGLVLRLRVPVDFNRLELELDHARRELADERRRSARLEAVVDEARCSRRAGGAR